MRTLAIALAVSLVGSAALAETTVIHKEGVGGDTTVVRKDVSDTTVVKKDRVESTGSLGCQTKSVTKTNDMGDSVSKTKTEC